MVKTKIYLSKLELNSMRTELEKNNIITLDLNGLILTGKIEFGINSIILLSLKTDRGRELDDKLLERDFLEEVLKSYRKTRLQKLDKETLIEFALAYCQLMDRNYCYSIEMDKIYK